MDKIPNWLRWVLFVPASFLALLVVYPIIQIGNYFFSPMMDSMLTKIFTVIVGSSCSAFAFVWTATKVVPDHKFLVSLIMTTIYAMLSGLILASKMVLGHNSNTSWFEVLSIVLVGTLGAIAACYQVYEGNSGAANQAKEYFDNRPISWDETKSSEAGEDVVEEDDYPWEVISLTSLTLIKCEQNPLVDHVKEYYQALGKNPQPALLHAKAAWLWFLRSSIIIGIEISSRKKRLIEEFDLVLHRETQNWSVNNKKFDLFAAFKKLDSEISNHQLDLRLIPNNKYISMTFANIILSFIHENLGDVTINLDTRTMKIPLLVFEQVRAEVQSLLTC